MLLAYLVQLDSLEFTWGLNRYTLNLHTRYNVCICKLGHLLVHVLYAQTLYFVPVGSKLHHLFDNKNLLFLPTKDIIEEYHDHNITTPLPYRPEDSGAQVQYSYHWQFASFLIIPQV